MKKFIKNVIHVLVAAFNAAEYMFRLDMCMVWMAATVVADVITGGVIDSVGLYNAMVNELFPKHVGELNIFTRSKVVNLIAIYVVCVFMTVVCTIGTVASVFITLPVIVVYVIDVFVPGFYDDVNRGFQRLCKFAGIEL